MEGRRLVMFSCRCCNTSFPAADMSAPESGRTSNSRDPLAEVTSILITGAGSLAKTFLKLEIVRCLTLGVLDGVCAAAMWGFRLAPLLRQTLANGQLSDSKSIFGHMRGTGCGQMGEL